MMVALAVPAEQLRGDSIGSEARAWLDGEIAAGRLAPALDDSELATIASILLRQAGRAPEKKKTANGARSSAVSAKEARTSGTSQT